MSFEVLKRKMEYVLNFGKMWTPVWHYGVPDDGNPIPYLHAVSKLNWIA